jgi:hypothetical protein
MVYRDHRVQAWQGEAAMEFVMTPWLGVLVLVLAQLMDYLWTRQSPLTALARRQGFDLHRRAARVAACEEPGAHFDQAA